MMCYIERIVDFWFDFFRRFTFLFSLFSLVVHSEFNKVEFLRHI